SSRTTAIRSSIGISGSRRSIKRICWNRPPCGRSPPGSKTPAPSCVRGRLAMLTSEGCHARRRRLWDAVPEDVGTLVLTAPESLIYLPNYAPSPFVFNTVESAAVLIMHRDRTVLLADNLLRAFLDLSFANEVVALEWYTGKKSAPPRQQRLAVA